jgi:hypothetical protein
MCILSLRQVSDAMLDSPSQQQQLLLLLHKVDTAPLCSTSVWVSAQDDSSTTPQAPRNCKISLYAGGAIAPVTATEAQQRLPPLLGYDRPT